MSTVCPVCNGISTYTVLCPCGNKMKDSGPAEDYSGPYSPYYNTSFNSNVCCHLFSCTVCGTDTRFHVPVQEL